jgi:beta-galactosidase
VHSATNAAGDRIHIVHNWNWKAIRLELPRPMADALTDTAEPLETLDLGPWDVRVVLEA